MQLENQHKLPLLPISVYTLIGITLVLLGSFLNSKDVQHFFHELELNSFEKNIQENISVLTAEEIEIVESLENKENKTDFLLSKSSFFDDLYYEKGIGFALYEDNKLVYNSQNHIPAKYNFSNDIQSNAVQKYGNGWYYIQQKSLPKNLSLVSFLLIKNQYAHENQYLKNDFFSRYNLSGYTLNLGESQGSFSIFSASNEFLFALTPYKNSSGKSFYYGLLSIVAVLGICLIIYALQIFFIWLVKEMHWPKILVLFHVIVVILARYAMIESQFPKVLYELPLFFPDKYAASELLPSLGDLFLNSITLIYLSYFVYRSFKKFTLQNQLLKVIITTSFLSYSFLINIWIESLIIHSNINLNLNEIYKFDGFSFLSILIISILFTSFLLLVITGLKLCRNIKLTYLVFSSAVFLIIGILVFPELSYLSLFWPIFFLVSLFIVRAKEQIPLWNVILILAIFCVASTSILINSQAEKELNSRKLLAQQLAEEKDPLAEFLYQEIEIKIKEDYTLKDSLSDNWYDNRAIKEFLSKKYFSGYWNKYELYCTACREDDSLLVQPENIPQKCHDIFSNKLENAEKAEDADFFHLQNEYSSQYIGVVEIFDTKSKSLGPIKLYLELIPKLFQKNEGYPELLLDNKEIKELSSLGKYHYARYVNQELTDQSGEHKYALKIDSSWTSAEDGFKVITSNHHNHLIYSPNKNKQIILSSEEITSIDGITYFSYLFAFTGAFILIIGLLLKQFPIAYKIRYSSFSIKIQAFIVITILLLCFVFGAGASYFIKKNYEEKNKRQISEKTRSVLIELEHKLGESDILDQSINDYITFYLIKFSNVFYTDINIYGTNGSMIATSRNEVFEKNLIGRFMNAEAFNAMKNKHSAEYIHKEKVGDLEYLSAYVPFRNSESKILAYLNLPYFAKQNELQEELSVFISTLINIYVFLLILMLVAAVLYSNYISRPIKLIGEKIGALQFGTTNEKIQWKGTDEIGKLVQEYNKKVEELAISAEKLAQSERESAWREMAKQVAHEIKNPLTPMRLSVQMLQRSSNENDSNLKDRLNRTTDTLLEQIETLTNIANEFSNFAKMPTAKNEKFSLYQLLDSVVTLYTNNAENTAVTFSSDTTSATINADKNQMNRVFNNLIKNAIQAIPYDKEGKVDVHLTEKENNYIIRITDNGTGIADEMKNKIFTPNFTTKTAGMGLGLAMVKNIIENSGGEIWFETSLDKGTSFFVKLVKENA